jgi:hypothetical protein
MKDDSIEDIFDSWAGKFLLKILNCSSGELQSNAKPGDSKRVKID